jgi:hypothetical protein
MAGDRQLIDSSLIDAGIMRPRLPGTVQYSIQLQQRGDRVTWKMRFTR